MKAMKKNLMIVLTFATLVVLSKTSFSQSIFSQTKVIDYSTGEVSNTSWKTLFYDTEKQALGLSISHSGSVGLKVAVGASGSEVHQMTIPANQSAPVFYPVAIHRGQHISIQDESSTGLAGQATGRGIFNLIFK